MGKKSISMPAPTTAAPSTNSTTPAQKPLTDAEFDKLVNEQLTAVEEAQKRVAKSAKDIKTHEALLAAARKRAKSFAKRAAVVAVAAKKRFAAVKKQVAKQIATLQAEVKKQKAKVKARETKTKKRANRYAAIDAEMDGNVAKAATSLKAAKRTYDLAIKNRDAHRKITREFRKKRAEAKKRRAAHRAARRAARKAALKKLQDRLNKAKAKAKKAKTTC